MAQTPKKKPLTPEQKRSRRHHCIAFALCALAGLLGSASFIGTFISPLLTGLGMWAPAGLAVGTVLVIYFDWDYDGKPDRFAIYSVVWLPTALTAWGGGLGSAIDTFVTTIVTGLQGWFIKSIGTGALETLTIIFLVAGVVYEYKIRKREETEPDTANPARPTAGRPV